MPTTCVVRGPPPSSPAPASERGAAAPARAAAPAPARPASSFVALEDRAPRCAASAAAVGWSSVAVADSSTPNFAATALRSSTAISRPASISGWSAATRSPSSSATISRISCRAARQCMRRGCRPSISRRSPGMQHFMYHCRLQNVQKARRREVRMRSPVPHHRWYTWSTWRPQ